jgi:hypothetical protein
MIFQSKLKSGETIQIESLETFKYFGQKFAYHRRLNERGEQVKTFSVSHVATGICIDPGFGYENFSEARSGTELYLDIVGKDEFLKAVSKHRS